MVLDLAKISSDPFEVVVRDLASRELRFQPSPVNSTRDPLHNYTTRSKIMNTHPDSKTTAASIVASGVSRHLNGIGSLPRYTGSQESDLAMRARAGDRDARELLTQSHLRLVVRVAFTTAGGSDLLDDHARLGLRGLATAIDNFKPNNGIRFETIASRYIRTAIQRGAAWGRSAIGSGNSTATPLN